MGKGPSVDQGEGFFKSKEKGQYLGEPATKVVLPVIIWWTFRNKNPVGTTGERSDKGQVSKMRARSIPLGATIHKQPGWQVPIVGERTEDPLFHSWGEGKSTLRQLLKEILAPKSTFCSCSPATVAPNLRALSVLFHCLCVCARTHAHAGVCGTGWRQGKGPHQEGYGSLQICYHWETSRDSPGKRRGLLLGPRDNRVRRVLPTVPAHHFQHKRPLVAARDRHFEQSKCPYG